MEKSPGLCQFPNHKDLMVALTSSEAISNAKVDNKASGIWRSWICVNYSYIRVGSK